MPQRASALWSINTGSFSRPETASITLVTGTPCTLALRNSIIPGTTSAGRFSGGQPTGQTSAAGFEATTA